LLDSLLQENYNIVLKRKEVIRKTNI